MCRYATFVRFRPQTLTVVQQLLVITRFTILVYDVATGAKLETFGLDPTWLQPVGAAAGIPVESISHSVKIYKGKTFLLVSSSLILLKR